MKIVFELEYFLRRFGEYLSEKEYEAIVEDSEKQYFLEQQNMEITQ